MTNADRTAQQKFRRDAINVMTTQTEVVTMRLDRTEATVARSADSVEQLVQAITAQSASLDRLERAVTDMVAGINAQRETMHQMMQQQGEFLKLATRQADIIGALTTGKAS